MIIIITFLSCPLTYLIWSFFISAAWWWGEWSCWDEHNKCCSICHYSINLSSASLFFYVILVYLGTHRIFLHWCCRGIDFFYYLYMYNNAYCTNIHILISHCLHLSSGDAFLYSCTGKKVTGNWVVLWVLDGQNQLCFSYICIFFVSFCTANVEVVVKHEWMCHFLVQLLLCLYWCFYFVWPLQYFGFGLVQNHIHGLVKTL